VRPDSTLETNSYYFYPYSQRATDGMTGEPDGVVTIQVPGNQYHTIAVEGGLHLVV